MCSKCIAMAQWDAVRNRSNWAASLLEKLVNEQRFLTRGATIIITSIAVELKPCKEIKRI